MIVRVERIELIGAGRTVRLVPGLNIVTGPIATGKTTFVRLVRFLLGSSLGRLPPEANRVVSAVSGSVVLRDSRYSIVRPAVTTRTARVDIAGDDEALRLEAMSSQTGDSYIQWLLDRLNLPRLAGC